jgi:ESCRT-II complex subunit VPS36
MEELASIELSPAGRPTLFEGEVELKISSWTQLIAQRKKQFVKEILPVGVTMLTNCRCIFVIPATAIADSSSAAAAAVARDQGWALTLEKIRAVEDCAGFLSKSTRISMFLTNQVELGLKFHQGEKEQFLQVIQEALVKKSWLRINMNPSKDTSSILRPAEETKPSFSSTNAGINGILRKQEKDMAALDSLRRSALSDLDSLMKSAEDVVKVVKKYSAYLEDKRSNHEGSETESVAGDVNEIEELLQNIGMVSPVTKLSAGRSYYQQLARQIVDLLLSQNRLLKIGGMITLPDLYCVVNRARGTELLSPEDLLKACFLVDDLQLGIHFKKFPSGVMVMQLVALTDARIADRIVEIFRQQQSDMQQPGGAVGLKISDMAVALQMSVIVTKEMLLQVERFGKLCRDECSDGLYFYLNLFESW